MNDCITLTLNLVISEKLEEFPGDRVQVVVTIPKIQLQTFRDRYKGSTVILAAIHNLMALMDDEVTSACNDRKKLI